MRNSIKEELSVQITEEKPEKPSSYGQIFRSSSILGGSQLFVYLISIGRTKAAAVFLGPGGLGMLNLFQTSITLIGTVSGLGISNSGVREIAEAAGSGDEEKIRRTSAILHRVALLTGLLGWLIAAALAIPISKITFGESNYSGSIALLGVCLLLGAIGSSYAAILQGTRRIGKLAKVQIASNAIASIIAVSLFAAFGTKAIVPSMVSSAAVICIISWFIGKRANIEYGRITWKETFRGSRELLVMGSAFMWNAVTTGLVAFAIRAMVVRYEGLESNGIYQAAWAISGMFAAFILQAMGTDFYPRLTAVARDPEKMNRLVNEQTEIGLLLAGPGVLFTLSMAPFLMELLYSSAFESGTPLVCWFVVGVFGQVVSWPLGFIQIARGASRSFIVTQTIFNGLHFGLSVLFFRTFGMVGIGMAYVALYVIYTIGMLFYMNRVTGFRWSPGAKRLIVVISILVCSGFGLTILNFGIKGSAAGAVLAILGGFFCFRELFHRLPPNHRLVAILRKIPGISKN